MYALVKIMRDLCKRRFGNGLGLCSDISAEFVVIAECGGFCVFLMLLTSPIHLFCSSQWSGWTCSFTSASAAKLQQPFITFTLLPHELHMITSLQEVKAYLGLALVAHLGKVSIERDLPAPTNQHPTSTGHKTIPPLQRPSWTLLPPPIFRNGTSLVPISTPAGRATRYHSLLP